MSAAQRGPQGAAARQSALDAALPIVERLRKAVEAESADIEQGRLVNYEAYSLVKNQGLLELNRLAPAIGGPPPPGPLREALADLHAKLEINRRALALQLRACAAVAEIIARAIRDGQSDGTYSALSWRRPSE